MIKYKNIKVYTKTHKRLKLRAVREGVSLAKLLEEITQKPIRTFGDAERYLKSLEGKK